MSRTRGIGWFLPLWERAAEELGVDVSFASLLRHPAEAVGSAMKWYGDWQTPASRTVSWVNIMLETELATRGRKRVFVRYDDLLDELADQVARTAGALDIPILPTCSPAHGAGDRRPRRPVAAPAEEGFADIGVPALVQPVAEQVWDELLALTRPPVGGPAGRSALDAGRAELPRVLRRGRGDRTVLAACPAAGGIRGIRESAAGQGSGSRGLAVASGGGADAVIRAGRAVRAAAAAPQGPAGLARPTGPHGRPGWPSGAWPLAASPARSVAPRAPRPRPSSRAQNLARNVVRAAVPPGRRAARSLSTRASSSCAGRDRPGRLGHQVEVGARVRRGTSSQSGAWITIGRSSTA